MTTDTASRLLTFDRDNWTRAIQHAYAETMGGTDNHTGAAVIVAVEATISEFVADDCDAQEWRCAQRAVRMRPNVMGVCIGDPAIEYDPATRRRTVICHVTVTSPAPLAPPTSPDGFVGHRVL